jgi:adenylate kinase family enzyme
MKKICVIGNGGGGKTTLGLSLKERYNLPLFHVDSIQFLENWVLRDIKETEKLLDELTLRESWIIDGFGSLEVLFRRFKKSDIIIFVDFPLWRHYWWCTKRQIKSIWHGRFELPEGCNEASLARTYKLYKILFRVHRDIRPALLKFFAKREIVNKVRTVKNLKDWNQIFYKGIKDAHRN